MKACFIVDADGKDKEIRFFIEALDETKEVMVIP